MEHEAVAKKNAEDRSLLRQGDQPNVALGDPQSRELFTRGGPCLRPPYANAPQGFVVFHFPRVKSGTSIVLLRCAIDSSVNGVITLNMAAS